jgi:hypothetical protein
VHLYIWEAFCRALCGAGVQLQDQDDTLLWTGGDSFDTLNVKNIYLDLAKKKWVIVIGDGKETCGSGI